MSDNIIQNPKKLLSSLISPARPSLVSSEAATCININGLELPIKARYLFTDHNQAVGLGIIVEALNNEESSDESSSSINNAAADTRRILLATKLKVQIPASSRTSSSLESICSPIEFGIKTKEMQLALHNFPAQPTMTTTVPMSLLTTAGSLSPREIELSEDYTCVILHGPNPKTTHIFDNCIIENYGQRSLASKKYYHEDKPPMVYPSDKFLSHCGTCKKRLSLGQDIFIYNWFVINLEVKKHSAPKNAGAKG